MLEGKAAFGDWKADRPGVRRLIRPDDHAGPLPHRIRIQRRRPGRPSRRRQATSAAGLFGRADRLRHRQSARRARRAEWRPVRRRQQGQPDTRLSSRRGQRQAGRGKRSSPRPQPALRHRLLPAGRQPAMGLCRQHRQRRALCLSQRRPEGRRRAGVDRRRHPLQPPLDPRHRLLARRQDALSLGRLRLECRRGHRQGTGGRARAWVEIAAAGCGLGL